MLKSIKFGFIDVYMCYILDAYDKIVKKEN